MKIRVAIVLPSFDVGGTENMVANLVSYIDKTRFQILVISLASPRNTHIQKRIEETGTEIFYGGKGEFSSWKVFVSVYMALQKFRPDLIHSNMYAYAFCVPYLLTHRVLLLHTIHNKPANEFKKKYKRLISFLYWRKKAVPVAISHIIEREMWELYSGLCKVERIYNPVETEKFCTKREKCEKREVVFINVARFMKQKNHFLLLKSFAGARKQVPFIHLMLVGDGELRNEIEKMVSNLKMDSAVTFVGNVDNVNDYLAEADVFVLSSDYEGLPLSVLEAMASGLPILATEVGGLADLVTDNGYLVQAGDERKLEERIVELANNAALRYEMGKRSAAHAAQYDSREFIRKYEELYRKYARSKIPFS